MSQGVNLFHKSGTVDAKNQPNALTMCVIMSNTVSRKCLRMSQSVPLVPCETAKKSKYGTLQKTE